MSAILISSISTIVGLYGLLAAAFWVLRSLAIIDAASGSWFVPSLHVSITLFAAALMLYAIHAQRTRPRSGAALHIAMLLVVLVMGSITASGYEVASTGEGNLVTLRLLAGNGQIPYGLIIALIGFLSLFRRIGPWALMVGGIVILVAYLLLFPQAKTIAPILGALISIGLLLVGNQKYREETRPY